MKMCAVIFFLLYGQEERQGEWAREVADKELKVWWA